MCLDDLINHAELASIATHLLRVAPSRATRAEPAPSAPPSSSTSPRRRCSVLPEHGVARKATTGHSLPLPPCARWLYQAPRHHGIVKLLLPAKGLSILDPPIFGPDLLRLGLWRPRGGGAAVPSPSHCSSLGFGGWCLDPPPL
jgi:hypothetical protein